MEFSHAVQACLQRYADFQGRASRAEYWWWVLFLFLVSSALAIVHEKLCDLFWLAVLVPTVAVTTRRLHDTNRSGWWQLIELVPLVGFILMIVWLVEKPAEPNRFEQTSLREA
ncbi:DUF805 domain-containing protein [Piscinibacter terrae]|uniref:DUF805 domain-containing protein n=1 Tax=Piscinibacter terrae TaxID=2496871 RepID=A0A3N7HUS8_9BURK|nr:DUF805 domain-containing protein [Albitalea terrae]RQP26024.1 DUF805 domain-containing protein [Albitalea terrae]